MNVMSVLMRSEKGELKLEEQRMERFRRSEKSPTLVDRLTFFGDCGFKVGEYYIALQQPLDHRYRHRCGRPEI